MNHEGELLDFHALRHTCGAWLAKAGVHPKVVQTVMRHSTITLTYDHYGHLFPGQEADAVSRLADVMSPPVAAAATGTDGENIYPHGPGTVRGPRIDAAVGPPRSQAVFPICGDQVTASGHGQRQRRGLGCRGREIYRSAASKTGSNRPRIEAVMPAGRSSPMFGSRDPSGV